jgi:hypothetical protein
LVRSRPSSLAISVSLVKILPEEQQNLVSQVTAELDPSIEQTIERVGLDPEKFRTLDVTAAQNLSRTYADLIKGADGGFGSFGSSGL